MIRGSLGIVGGLLLATIASTAHGQFVRVGPFGGVSVRAPFVSVDALPYGGVRVRAPFTAVGTGFYGYYPHRYGVAYPTYRYRYPSVVYDPYPVTVYRPAPVYPVPVPVPVYETVPVYPVEPAEPRYESAMPASSGSVADALRESATRLARSLEARGGDSDIWLDYLGPWQIVGAIDQNADPRALADLLKNYDGVVGNGRLQSIQRASGFSTTRSLLRQYVTTPVPTPAPPVSDDDVPVPAPSADEPVPAPSADEPVPAPRADEEDASGQEGPTPSEVPPPAPEPLEPPAPAESSEEDVARQEKPTPI